MQLMPDGICFLLFFIFAAHVICLQVNDILGMKISKTESGRILSQPYFVENIYCKNLDIRTVSQYKQGLACASELVHWR